MEILNFFISFIVIIFGSVIGSYLAKKGDNLATKEDIGKITKEVEDVKNIHKENYELSKTEREFYNDMVKELQKFLSVIKRHELNTGSSENSVTRDVIMSDPGIKTEFLNFVDNANEILARAFVFLNEENYKLFKEAFDIKKNFAGIRYNLLDAMRKSIYSDTNLKAKEDSRDIKY